MSLRRFQQAHDVVLMATGEVVHAVYGYTPFGILGLIAAVLGFFAWTTTLKEI